MKMDGAKTFTDTIGMYRSIYGKLVYCLDRSVCASMRGPGRNKNPGGSKIIAV